MYTLSTTVDWFSQSMHQCSTLKVKAKIWTAHLNGKKHRDSCERLKQQLASGPKRQSDVTSTQNGAPPVKKVKGTDRHFCCSLLLHSHLTVTSQRHQRHLRATRYRRTSSTKTQDLGYFPNDWYCLLLLDHHNLIIVFPLSLSPQRFVQYSNSLAKGEGRWKCTSSGSKGHYRRSAAWFLRR